MCKEISVFGQKISCFTLMISLGFLAAILVLLFDINKTKSDKERWNKFFCILPILIVGGFGGAILFDMIAHYNDDYRFVIKGMSFAGGIISAIILFLIFYPLCVSKNKKFMYKDINQLVCPLLIGHAFGRIGCFMGGCCYGLPTNSIFGVTFPVGSLQYEQYGEVVKVLPTQLFEAVFLFILFIVLFFLKKLKKYKIEIYLIGYGIFRFFNEFLRGDNRGVKILLSPSQWTSILFLIVGILIFIYVKNMEKSDGVSN